MHYDKLPIFKSAMDLVVYIEVIVKNFDKYHRYTMGEELRNRARDILFGIQKANMNREKHQELIALRDKCEEFKMIVAVAQEIKAFNSFKQFENSSKLSYAVCRQAQAWLNSQNRSANINARVPV
jgi:hypothetical protein